MRQKHVIAFWRANRLAMSDQELFSEDFCVGNSSPESGTEYDSDGGSPRARPAFSVGNFFSKRQRCDPNNIIATGGGSIVQQQQQQGVGIVDKRRRKKRHALQCVTSNRRSSTNSVPVQTSSATMPSTRCANDNQLSKQGEGDHMEESLTSPPVQCTTPVPSSKADIGIKSALQEITSLLNTVVQRVERIESELKNSQSNVSSSGHSATPSRCPCSTCC